MTGIRRAFVLASLGRYMMMVVNLAATLIMARLLAPADYGVAVLGGSALALAEAIRAVGGGAYLVQQKDLTPEQIRTNFTISLIATAVLVAAVLTLVRPLTEFFGRPELKPYLQVAVLGFVAGPITYQISALMSRSLDFGRMALVTTACAVINAGTGIFLALQGWGYMSLAWGTAVSALAAMVFYLNFWRDWSIFRPRLSEWRDVIRFGVHDSAFGMLSQIAEAAPYLIVGRVLDASSVGLLQRALLLALFPERVILAGVGAVALPAFSRLVREGNRPKAAYLNVLGLITAAQWPALVTLILLAEPVVYVLLGSQWQDAVPLLRIFAGTLLFSFPMALHYPTLVAIGRIRIVPITLLAPTAAMIGILAFAAPLGSEAVALSAFAIVPFSGLLSLAVVRHFLKFSWLELVAVLTRSAVITMACALCPLAAVMATGWHEKMSIPLAMVVGVLAIVGWTGGMWVVHHPLLQEIAQLWTKLRSRIVTLVR